MPGQRPTTIDAYIDAAPPEARPHLRRLRQILRRAAPHAQEVIKWNQPFFVEPRFLFAFSANKAHLSFTPGQGVLRDLADALKDQDTTANLIRFPYAQPLPEAVIRRVADHAVKLARARKDNAFW